MAQDITAIIENIQKSVEKVGKSGRDTVYLDNVSFRIDARRIDTPYGADRRAAEADFGWFLDCEDCDGMLPRPPVGSWWVNTFGEDAVPYGSSWDLLSVYDALSSEDSHRRAILYNPDRPHPACIICYQFQPVDHRVGGVHLDMTVTMRSSDVVNCLPQDVLMSQLLLHYVADIMDMVPGWITFNIANAHIYWEDVEVADEFDIDMPL